MYYLPIPQKEYWTLSELAQSAKSVLSSERTKENLNQVVKELGLVDTYVPRRYRLIAAKALRIQSAVFAEAHNDNTSPDLIEIIHKLEESPRKVPFIPENVKHQAKDILQKYTIPFLECVRMALLDPNHPLLHQRLKELGISRSTILDILPSNERRQFDSLVAEGNSSPLNALLGNCGKNLFWAPDLKTGNFEIMVASDPISFKEYLAKEWESLKSTEILGLHFDDFYGLLRINYVAEDAIKIYPDE